MADDNDKLRAGVTDLEGRSRRCNVHLIGVPEDVLLFQTPGGVCVTVSGLMARHCKKKHFALHNVHMVEALWRGKTTTLET